MKNFLVISLFVMTPIATFCQEKEGAYSSIEQQMENQAEKEETESEDDSFVLQLDHFTRHPLNLNEAGEDDLKQLFLLNDLQIKNFIEYRRLFGKLVNVYELQAIPSWNIAMIRKLIPFITVKDDNSLIQNIKHPWKGGEHNILVRSGMVLEKAKGFHRTGSGFYAGDRMRLYVRYRYTFNNRLEWGVH